MKKPFILFITCLFVLGIFSPLAHILVHNESGEHFKAVSLSEFCGGVNHPCSQPKHDHSKSGHHARDCALCHHYQFQSGTTAITCSPVFELTLSKVQFYQEISFQPQNITTQLGSRAPPVNS